MGASCWTGVRRSDVSSPRHTFQQVAPDNVATSMVMQLVTEDPCTPEDGKDTPRGVASALVSVGSGGTTPDMPYAAPPVGGQNLLQHSTAEDCILGNCELPYLSGQLEALGVLVSRSEVKLRRVLCSTNKSNVYRAEWKGKDVVAKVVQVCPSVDDAADVVENSKKELVHEIKNLCKLRHPSLVQFIGAWIDVDDGFHGMLTEYCQAGDVETYMQQQWRRTKVIYVPPARLGFQWAFSTADALAFLHNLDCPIIHRDLKPLNLLLTGTLDLKLTDLGLSKVLPRQSRGCSPPAPRMSGGVGTWRYMAPEVVRYEQYTDRADVYSFSLILVFIFSGKPPFHEFAKEDPELILKAYLNGQEPRPDLTDDMGTGKVRELIRNSWHTDAASRPSAQECARQLAEMLEAMPAKRPRGATAVHNILGTCKRSPTQGTDLA